MPHNSEHSVLLGAAQQELAIARLSFLRDPAAPIPALDAHARLVGEEGQERLEEAVRHGQYPAAELAQLPQALAELARAAVLHEGRRGLARWLHEELHVSGSAQLPAKLLAMLAQPRGAALGPQQVVSALGEGLEPHVGYWLDLRERAQLAAEAQLTAAERLLPKPAAPAQPEAAQPEAPPPTAASLEERAQQWLAESDDAAHELTAWLIKQSPVTAGDELARLWLGLRAPTLDGLARPQRRFHRLAEGARRLGFERDMNACMHGESALGLLLPAAACVSAGTRTGVRVLQPGIEYGWLSDLAVAQGVGEGLALALVSPTLGPVAGALRAGSVTRALGGLFLQLRAERGYLQRVDGIDAKPASQLARQTALWLLVRSRLAAACCIALDQPARSHDDRCELLARAAERALGRTLPPAVLALDLVQEVSPAQTFAALSRGCQLHAALRERYDSDFYLNPRVSDVVRGAAARGSLLSAADFAAELRAGPRAGIARLLELLG